MCSLFNFLDVSSAVENLAVYEIAHDGFYLF